MGASVVKAEGLFDPHRKKLSSADLTTSSTTANTAAGAEAETAKLTRRVRAHLTPHARRWSRHCAPGKVRSSYLSHEQNSSDIGEPANDTAVQRRTGEGAKRPTRPSDGNGGLAGDTGNSGILFPP